MTKRRKILAGICGGVLVAAGFGLALVTRWAAPDFSPQYFYHGPEEPLAEGPPVLLWYDSPHERISDAIRIEVHHGVAFTQENNPTLIPDVTAYVWTQLEGKEPRWVVISGSQTEKIGSMIAVIDACKKTPARGIALNYYAVGSE